MMKYTYILLNLFTILPVLLLSFESKLRFVNKWKFTVPGILIIGTFFGIWDYYFTINQIWKFNPDYTLPLRIFSMPLEEYFFFLFTPFACIFIYESVKVYYQPTWIHPVSKPLTLFLSLVFAGVAIQNSDKIYTIINFTIASIVLLLAFIILNKKLLGQFWITFIIHLIPFWIVNGILTSLPVLIYNHDENLNLRIGSIPVEDHVYSLILFLSNLWAYEWFKKKYHSDGL